MAKKSTRARAVRRVERRRHADLVKDKERLAHLEVGGSAERPIAISTASLVEPDARARPCPLCEGALRVDEHAAEAGLRVVHASCTRCGVRRRLYYRIDAPAFN
jgi:hypothetical protein